LISKPDYLRFVDEQLEAMIRMVQELGDDLANRRLKAPGSNSPFVILTHCLGVMEYWGGHVVAGRPSERHRASEFAAEGEVRELVQRARAARDQLVRDVEGAEPESAPRSTVDSDPDMPQITGTQGGALLHIYEELARHRGQMDITHDVLQSAGH
jgi:uncharacterized damage-inducible protein DinB